MSRKFNGRHTPLSKRIPMGVNRENEIETDAGREGGSKRRERTETDGLGEDLADLKGFDGIHCFTYPPHSFFPSWLSHSHAPLWLSSVLASFLFWALRSLRNFVLGATFLSLISVSLYLNFNFSFRRPEKPLVVVQRVLGLQLTTSVRTEEPFRVFPFFV